MTDTPKQLTIVDLELMANDPYADILPVTRQMLLDAAATIAAKDAEIERLKADERFAERVRQDLHKIVNRLSGSDYQTHGLDYTGIIGYRIDKMKAEIERLRRRCEQSDRDCEQVMIERDLFETVIQETHIELGGDGEWVTRIPEPPAPNSGNLNRDVPELARLKMAEIARLMAEVERLRKYAKHDGNCKWYYTHNVACTCGLDTAKGA